MALIQLKNSVHDFDVKMKRGQRPYNDLVEHIIENKHISSYKEMAEASMGTKSKTAVSRIEYTLNHYIRVSPVLTARLKAKANEAKLAKLNAIIKKEVMGRKVTVRNVAKLQRLFAARDTAEKALQSYVSA